MTPLDLDPIEGDPREWLDRQEEAFADLLARELTRIVRASTARFADTLTAAADFSAFDDIPAQWWNTLNVTVLPFVEQMYLAGSLQAWIGSPFTPAATIEQVQAWTRIVNDDAILYMQGASNRLVAVGDGLWNTIRQDLATAIERGDSTEDVKVRIEKTTNMSEFRADTIARTETTRAYNAGTFQAGQALGDMGPKFKEWISAAGPRTREEHAAADGQVVAYEEAFDVGGEALMFPGDDAGSAWNTINCRCSMAEYFDGDTLPDGTVVGDTETQAADINTFDEQADDLDLDDIRPLVEASNDIGHFQERMSEGFVSDIVGERDIFSVTDNNDAILRGIMEEQGFNAPPSIVSAEKYDELVADGWTPVYRGINAETQTDLDSFVENFTTGTDPYVGRGLYGNGIYTSDIRDTAQSYASESGLGIGSNGGVQQARHGTVLDIAVNPNARIVDVDDLRLEHRAEIERVRAAQDELRTNWPTREVPHPYLDGETMRENIPLSEFRKGDAFFDDAQKLRGLIDMENVLSASDDVGKFAAMKGYDVIQVNTPRAFNDQFQMIELPDTYYVILNRSAVAVKEVK
jgi:SPP1 gp7 family putative phage head morphogenesis protein